MRPFVSAGTKFLISESLPSMISRAGFEALSYTQVRGVRSVGDVGTQYRTGMNDPIGGIPSLRRGGLDAMSLQLELYSISDAGQSLLKSTIDSPFSFSYRLEQPNGDIRYFTAIATSRLNGIGDTSSIADIKMVLQINSAVIEV